MSIHAAAPKVRVQQGRLSEGVTVYSTVFRGTSREAAQYVRDHASEQLRAEVFMKGRGWVELGDLCKEVGVGKNTQDPM